MPRAFERGQSGNHHARTDVDAGGRDAACGERRHIQLVIGAEDQRGAEQIGAARVTPHARASAWSTRRRRLARDRAAAPVRRWHDPPAGMRPRRAGRRSNAERIVRRGGGERRLRARDEGQRMRRGARAAATPERAVGQRGLEAAGPDQRRDLRDRSRPRQRPRHRGRGSRAAVPSISVIDDSRTGMPHCSARAAALSGSRRSSVRRRSRSTSSRE